MLLPANGKLNASPAEQDSDDGHGVEEAELFDILAATEIELRAILPEGVVGTAIACGLTQTRFCSLGRF